MNSDELAEAKRQLAGFVDRLKLMRDGKLKTNKIEGSDYLDTTSISILQAEESVAALERKIARLEDDNASRS